MQHWLSEKLIETRRDDFRREIEQINLVREAESAYDARQSWIKRQLTIYLIYYGFHIKGLKMRCIPSHPAVS